MTGQAPQSRGAEAASHPTTRLTGNADGVAVLVFHDHALNELAVGKSKEIFHRAVDLRDQLAFDAGKRYVAAFLDQLFTEFAGQVDLIEVSLTCEQID